MINDKRSHTTLPAADLARAKNFYAEKLGLNPSTESPNGLFYVQVGEPGSSSIRRPTPLGPVTRRLVFRSTTSTRRSPASRPPASISRNTTFPV